MSERDGQWDTRESKRHVACTQFHLHRVDRSMTILSFVLLFYFSAQDVRGQTLIYYFDRLCISYDFKVTVLIIHLKA